MHEMDAIIFDMDGVIVDSEPVHQQVERAIFEELRLPVDKQEHESYLGTSSSDMFAAVAAAHPAEWAALDSSIARVEELERSRYRQALLDGRVPLVAGSVQAIRDAAERGFAIGIASSAPRDQIDDVMLLTDIGEIVRCVKSADDVVHSKPDPEIYLATAACLGIAAERCWVVEDSGHGVRAAVRAGMRCIAYRNPGSGAPDLSAAEIILDSMTGLIPAISSAGRRL